MKIRLSICMMDAEYAKRLFRYFDANYTEGLELSLFSELSSFLDFLKEFKVDILLTDYEPKGDLKTILLANPSVHTAYMTNEIIEGNEAEEHYIFKYQQAKQIYKEVEKICAIYNINIAFVPKGKATYVYAFLSAGSGAGATTVAHAAAISLAKKRKVLYLDLERYGVTDGYIEGLGNGTFDDIIRALCNKRLSLDTMLQAAVSESSDKVFYFAQGNHPSDLLNMEKEQLIRLLHALLKSEKYDYILIDVDKMVDEKLAEVFRIANQIVIVEDGTVVGREKFSRLFLSLQELDKDNSLNIFSKLSVFYNKYRSKPSIKGVKVLEKVVDLGTMPFYVDLNARDIIVEMSKEKKMQIFDRG